MAAKTSQLEIVDMKCPACSHDNSSDAQFCGVCGSPISSSVDKLEIDPRQAAAQKLQARSLTDNVRLQSGVHYVPPDFFDTEYLRHLYFSSEGRINRLRYFLGHLFLFGVTIVVMIIMTMIQIVYVTIILPLILLRLQNYVRILKL